MDDFRARDLEYKSNILNENMNFHQLEQVDSLGRYERYLRYMQLMDTMDMMEGICDTSASDMNKTLIRKRSVCRRQDIKTKMRLVSNSSKDSDEDVSDDDLESDANEESSESENITLEPCKRKIDLGNPYRGLKDSGNPLETMEDMEFFNSYKFSKKSIYNVMELIKRGLIKNSNRGTPVPPLIELLITLKYLTTGSIQKNAMNTVSQSTISRINTKVTRLIVTLQHRFIRFPENSEIEANKKRFYEKGKFPEVTGCIGSTHVGVRVKGVKDYNNEYVNENGYHSVRVQLIVGPGGEILDIVSKWPGSTPEYKIFNGCQLNHKFISGEINGILLGSSACYSTSVIMTYVKNPNLTGEHYYNDALTKTNTAEDCILEWKKRFRCLQTFLACKTNTQQNIITSCAILHNIAKLNNDPLPIDDAQSIVTEVKGKNNYPKKRIDLPAVDNLVLIERDEFIRNHFPSYYDTPSMSYASL